MLFQCNNIYLYIYEMYFCFERNVYTALLGKFSVTSSMQMKSRKGTASYTGRLRQVLSMCELFMFFSSDYGIQKRKNSCRWR